VSNAEWKAAFSFGIDNGELAGLSEIESFVLGAEIGAIYELAQLHPRIYKPVHAKNEHRIRRIMEKFGRTYTLLHMHNDVSESWMELKCEGESSYD
jgi:hypothetical protein